MPMGDFRPASGFMEGRRLGSAPAPCDGKRPYVDEPTRATGQLWASGLLGKRFTLSGVGAFDDKAAALGGALRFDYLRTGRVGLGVEAQLGWAWLGLTLPAAVRLFDQTWIYAGPRFAPRFQEWMLDLPVGVTTRVYDGLMIRAEYHATWIDLDYYSRRHHLALGVAYQF